MKNLETNKKKAKYVQKILWKENPRLKFDTLSCAKYNEIVYFVLYVKLEEETGLPQTPLNSLFSVQIIFIMFLRKSLELNFCQQQFVIFFCLTQFYLRWIIKNNLLVGPNPIHSTSLALKFTNDHVDFFVSVNNLIFVFKQILNDQIVKSET